MSRSGNKRRLQRKQALKKWAVSTKSTELRLWFLGETMVVGCKNCRFSPSRPSWISVSSVSGRSISLGNISTSKSILEKIFLWSPSSTWYCSFIFFWSSCCLQTSFRFSEIKLLQCFSSCANCTWSRWYKSCNAQFCTITPDQSLINEASMWLQCGNIFLNGSPGT